MSQQTLKCRQCGEILPESNFRPYYNGKGRYTVCRSCEKINSRAKYLRQKGDRATDADKKELAQIEQLYEYQRCAGLKPPRRRDEARDGLAELKALIDKYKGVAKDGPDELNEWLTKELIEEPDYYIDVVYEQLTSKYRPVLRIDQCTLTPVYDETYSDVLSKILERFTEYEDNYYN